MQIISEVPLTPKLLAQAFWELSATEEAEFFEELYEVVEGPRGGYSLGELQWLYMADEIEKIPKAKAMACALSSSIYLRATDMLSKYPSWG